jgi:hypothetical protein
MQSDLTRAIVIVVIATASGAGLVHAAPELREAGLLPAAQPAPELVYTILNLTDDMQAITACPIDLAETQRLAETALRRQRVRPVYSPIAGGPDVLTHEIAANFTSGECQWTAQTVFRGQTYSDLSEAAQSLSSTAIRLTP